MRSVVEIGASVPAFLGKLWKLVNDSETNHLISWSTGGKTFIIKHQADFARELLPLYYKHNNMASFIRQLNMYGFHKITSVENGGLRYERDEIEFSHPCFMRGHCYLLEHIKRKIANPKAIVTSSENGEKVLLKPEIMSKVLADVKQMKGKQENLDEKFSAMKQENEALWREVAILRQKHLKQQQIVNNLIQFLMSLVQPTQRGSTSANGVGVKRPYQLMINSAAHNSNGYPGQAKNIKLDKDATILEDLIEETMEDGPTIHELAHDDLIQNEISQDQMNPINYVTVDIATTPDIPPGHSPNEAPGSMQYQVTMDDGDELEAEMSRVSFPINQAQGLLPTSNSPIVTSPSPSMTSPSPSMTSPLTIPSPVSSMPMSQNIDPHLMDHVIPAAPSTSKMKRKTQDRVLGGKTLLSQSGYNNMHTDLKLPAEIFASDDSVGDAGIVTADEVPIELILQEPMPSLEVPTKDTMVGGINIKIENPETLQTTNKKNKKASKNVNSLKLSDIKTEIQDDMDWNTMTLATVNNNVDVNKFQNKNKRDYFYKNHESSVFGTSPKKKVDIDDHLDTMQTDLESLRELLRSDSYSLDTNTLMGLFGPDDPFYGLAFNPVDERPDSANSAEGTNQLMSYTGALPDFEDIDLPELEGEEALCASPAVVENISLNTPQVCLKSPAYGSKP